MRCWSIPYYNYLMNLTSIMTRFTEITKLYIDTLLIEPSEEDPITRNDSGSVYWDPNPTPADHRRGAFPGGPLAEARQWARPGPVHGGREGKETPVGIAAWIERCGSLPWVPGVGGAGVQPGRWGFWVWGAALRWRSCAADQRCWPGFHCQWIAAGSENSIPSWDGAGSIYFPQKKFS